MTTPIHNPLAYLIAVCASLYSLVNVYVDLLVFTRIAGTSETGSGRYWCEYYIEKHAICPKDYRIKSFFSIRHAHGDLCKHLGIDSSTDLLLHDITTCPIS